MVSTKDATLLVENEYSKIFLKLNEATEQHVIIKVLKEEQLTQRNILQFNNEFKITHQLIYRKNIIKKFKKNKKIEQDQKLVFDIVNHLNQGKDLITVEAEKITLVSLNLLAGNILYLENNITEDAFTPKQIELLNLLSAQLAIPIENALLYQYCRFTIQASNGRVIKHDLSHQISERRKSLIKIRQRPSPSIL